MKKVFKITGISILSVVLLLVAYGASIYYGILPIPKLAVNIVAQQQGLTPEEAEVAYKVTNVYGILKSAHSEELTELEKLLAGNPSNKELADFALRVYPKISEKTLEKVRLQLGIENSDFSAIKVIVDNGIKNLNSKGKFQISQESSQKLKAIQNKYGFTKKILKNLKF